MCSDETNVSQRPQAELQCMCPTALLVNCISEVIISAVEGSMLRSEIVQRCRNELNAKGHECHRLGTLGFEVGRLHGSVKVVKVKEG